MENRFEIFTVLINRINRNIHKIKKNEMMGYKLNAVHISCLYYLYVLDGLTATDLCEKCEEDKATISRAIEFLETNGYLVCEIKTGKRYKTPFKLTERGISTGEKIFEKVNKVLDDVSIGLTNDERKAFYRYLSIISDNLDAIAGK